ncbi:MAG: DUF885 domain-containing protein, partial [Holophagales bacterium]|nr:DUF885 domain-containing protein [Holophagales bacterium]
QDRRLEDLSPEVLEGWLQTNLRIREQLEGSLRRGIADSDLRLDTEAVHRQAARTVFRLQTLEVPRQDPLFWAGILSNVSTFLLVREDRPLADRLDALADRVAAIPRLCDQAAAALRQADAERMSPERARIAAARIGSTAQLYDEGLARASEALDGPGAEALRTELNEVSAPAAEALRELAATVEEMAATAAGDPRLGELYDESFRLGTGLDEPVDQVLARAERDLAATRSETAAFCRSIWEQVEPSSTEAPEEESEVIRACFRRIARDHAGSLAPFVEDFQRLAREAHDFVAENRILTPPGPFTLRVGPAPASLPGQLVGGIYPSGPFAPEADALLFVPAISDQASPEAKQAFYGDFNDHFNVMITPHETTPGHYAQGKLAALGPSKIRAVFTNGVYVEGWGTFSERLMLDHGWGTPLARVAHLKKQLENLARTIVDIRIHRHGMDRDQMLEFLRDEAMQDGQFAINMWTRALTSSPQLTTYYLGYRDIFELYETWRAENPEAPPLEFSDRMMSLGPVPIESYRSLF